MEVTLKLTVGEVNLILSSLAELPFKVSHQLIHKIESSALEQTNPPKE